MLIMMILGSCNVLVHGMDYWDWKLEDIHWRTFILVHGARGRVKISKMESSYHGDVSIADDN